MPDRRHAALAVALCAGALIAPDAASAATGLTLDQAAASVRYAVYAPTQTLGLAPSLVATDECIPGQASTRAVNIGYGRAGSRVGPHFGFFEGSPRFCGDAGESKRVGSAQVGRERVAVSVFCRLPCRGVSARDGARNGFLMFLTRRSAGRTIRIQFIASRMSLARALRVVRSLRRVDLDRPTVQLTGFLSADRRIWCTIGDDAACYMQSPQRSGEIHRDGTRHICQNGQFDGKPITDVCVQNWDYGAPVLRVGQRSEVGGFACTAAAKTIACVFQATGNGFAIDPDAGVTAIGT